jgi:hypothetical protein
LEDTTLNSYINTDDELNDDDIHEDDPVDDYVPETLEQKSVETKLVNKTKWADEDVFFLVRAVMDKAGAFDKVRQITVKSGKGAGKKDPTKQFSGYCYPRWKTITIRVPTTKFNNTRIGSDGRRERFRDQTVFNSEFFAKVLTHELQHLMGIDHRDMMEWWDLDCSYAKDINVRTKRVKRLHDVYGARIDIAP